MACHDVGWQRRVTGQMHDVIPIVSPLENVINSPARAWRHLVRDVARASSGKLDRTASFRWVCQILNFENRTIIKGDTAIFVKPCLWIGEGRLFLVVVDGQIVFPLHCNHFAFRLIKVNQTHYPAIDLNVNRSLTPNSHRINPDIWAHLCKLHGGLIRVAFCLYSVLCLYWTKNRRKWKRLSIRKIASSKNIWW